MQIKFQSIFVSILLLFAVGLNAQSGLNFQGVARNSNNIILASQPISLRLSILQGSATGTIEYSEIRKVTTNAQGLFSVVIGDQDASSSVGNFSAINWKNSPKFLKIEMDVTAGNNFVLLGTTQFQSVAYAQFANSVEAEKIIGILPVDKGGTGVNSLAALKTALAIDKVGVGLANVDNTSDLAKPISTATQTALDTKVSNASFTSTLAQKASATDLDLKAPIASPTFTGTVGGITKTMVGLSAVDNTSDLAKPISTATQVALDSKVSSTTFSAALDSKVSSTTFSATLNSKVSTETFSSTIATKEDAANKSTATDLGAGATSDILFPTQKAVKSYVDAQINSGGVADGGITNIKIADGAITNDKISDAAISWRKLNIQKGDIVGLGFAGDEEIIVYQAGQGLTETTTSIPNGRRTGSPLVTTTFDLMPITTSKLQDGAVTNDKVATGISKSKVGLGNVENTALSTWTGSSNLNSLGIIASGTWSATTIALNYGGTGATNASDARANLGLVIGTNVQAPLTSGVDYLAPNGSAASLTSFPTLNQNTTGNAATATLAGNITATSNSSLTNLQNLSTVGTITTGVWSGTTIAVSKGGTGATNASDARANLGLVIGTNVQAPLTSGVDYLAPNGSAASLTSFPTLNQNTTGNAATATLAGNITATSNSSLTNLQNLSTVGTITTGVWSATNIPFSKLNITQADINNLGIPSNTDLTTYNAGNGLVLNGTTFNIASNVLTSSYGGSATINGSSFNVTNLLNAGNAVVAGTITASSIVANTLYGDGSNLTNITASNVSDGIVSNAKLSNNAVTSAKISDGTIINSDISSSAAIGYSKLDLSNSIVGSDITDETITNSKIANATLTDTKFLGPVSVSKGGTGTSTLTTNAVIVGNGTNTVQFISPGTSGNVLTSNGTNWVSSSVTNSSTFNSDLSVQGVRFGLGAGNKTSNVAIGNDALKANTSGVYNTGIGNTALMRTTSGYDNTAIGNGSLTVLTTGINNTSVGSGSLNGNTTGSNNTAIGFSSYSSGNYSNSIAIGANAQVNGSNKIQLGDNQITSVNTTGKLTLDVVTYPNTDGTNGQVLSTNGSGTIGWSNIATTGTVDIGGGSYGIAQMIINGAFIADPTNSKLTYMRVGNMIFFTALIGKFASNANQQFEIEIRPPVASNFTNTYDAMGTITAGYTGTAAVVSGSVSANPINNVTFGAKSLKMNFVIANAGTTNSTPDLFISVSGSYIVR
jgi:hypothetical protein